jgi:tetratricopeptide (TPR) repeat protein
MIFIFFTPLFFLPVTIEPFETNKQTLLLVFTCTAALCWLVSMLLSGRATLRHGWMNILPWLLVLAFLIPAFFSIAPYLSWIGAHRSEYTSVLTVIALAVLFYLLGNTMNDRVDHRRVHLVMLVSAAVASMLALLEIFGVRIISTLAPSVALNSVGTLSSFATFLIVLQSFFTASLLSHHTGDSILHDGVLGVWERVLAYFVCLANVYVLLVLDDPTLWMLFAISFVILFTFVVFRAKDLPHHQRLVFSGILFLGSLLFWFVLPGIRLFDLPVEVVPSTSSSLVVAQSTLSTHSSLWGSGPGTYAFNFSQFHDASLNATDFWNTRFDRASSFVLTLVPTIGVFGITSLGLFVLFLFLASIKQTLHPTSRNEWLESFVHLVPWLTLVVSAFLVSWNMTLMMLFGVFSGLLASQVMRKKWSISLATVPGAKLAVSALSMILALGFLVGIFVTAQRYAAEVAFARAAEFDQEGAELQEIVTQLDRATTLNAWHDTYYRNLAEALLLRVDEELNGVSSIDTLTSESAQYIQSLVAASVNASARATELSDHNVLNWLSRGFIYRELVPVMGEASDFAVSAYTKAIELEPLNPLNWTELGRAYLVSAEQVRPITTSPDQATASEAQSRFDSFLASARTAFEKAVELKPNFAPAHFQLAVTYQRQGRMNDAIGKMESVAQYNQLDVGVFFQLGMLYLQRNLEGDRDRAQVAFEHVVKLSPEYANAHWFLASIYEAQGDIAAAVRELEVVLEFNPGNDLVEARLERLLMGQISTEIPAAIE